MSPASLHSSLERALASHNAGRLAEAEATYRSVLAACPGHADALHLLGVLCGDTGRGPEARKLIEDALQIAPRNADYRMSLGVLLASAGNAPAALEQWQLVVEAQPDLVEAHANIASTLSNLGRLDDAESAWRRAAQAAPRWVEARYRLGGLLLNRGRSADAEVELRAAIDLDPSHPDAQNLLACALADQKKFGEAAQHFEQVARSCPTDARVLVNLAQSLWQSGDARQAVPHFRRAIALDPQCAAAHHGLSAALRELTSTEEALAAATEAVRLAPDFALGYHNLGNVQYDLGLVEPAVASHRKSLSLNPHDSKAHSGLLLLLHYRDGDNAQLLFDEHRSWGDLHADPITGGAGCAAERHSPQPHRRLRIGYVSADLCAHPVAFFFQPILQGHDRDVVEITIYSSTPRADRWTELLRNPRDTWRDVRHLSDESLCRQIQRDRIDVLVDLSGHIAGNRLLAFARRPAPVQVTYLGYPDTTGMRAIDFKLTDAWHDPPGITEKFYAEKLIRLPGGAWCYRPRDEMPDVSIAPCVANGFVTFFSPNKFAKVTDEMLALWRSILHAVPRSRIILLTGGESAGDARIRRAMPGIDGDRIELFPRTTTGEYFDLYRRCDVVLDTFPYAGHTTTCDALWMGVPVITRSGRTHVSRAGTSVLSKVGLERWVTRSADDYVKCAVSAADEPGALQTLRATMRERLVGHGLLDGKRLAREIEDCYRAMCLKMDCR